MERYQRIAGCILGGAIGDALGWPVEFLSSAAIRRAYGENGITNLDKKGKTYAEFSDDTQMTLFTADGILRYLSALKQSDKPPDFALLMHESFRRWLFTQQAPRTSNDMRLLNGWLWECKLLHARRAPGNTCLSSLNENWIGSREDPINNSKGCGAVMRAAPIGLIFDTEEAFQKGLIAGAITHGHPSAYLGSAALARIIAELMRGESLIHALGTTIQRMKHETGHEECLLYLMKAYELSNEEIEPTRAISALGLGWVSEEALAIAVYCALKFEADPKQALLFAVNHDGDSDSTGSICGSILGAWKGLDIFEKDWVEHIEGSEILHQIVVDLNVGPDMSQAWKDRYPLGG
jgi:ADP-ribosylglycohydrolase